jgi:hypothetical protein
VGTTFATQFTQGFDGQAPPAAPGGYPHDPVEDRWWLPIVGSLTGLEDGAASCQHEQESGVGGGENHDATPNDPPQANPADAVSPSQRAWVVRGSSGIPTRACTRKQGSPRQPPELGVLPKGQPARFAPAVLRPLAAVQSGGAYAATPPTLLRDGCLRLVRGADPVAEPDRPQRARVPSPVRESCAQGRDGRALSLRAAGVPARGRLRGAIGRARPRGPEAARLDRPAPPEESRFWRRAHAARLPRHRLCLPAFTSRRYHREPWASSHRCARTHH